MRVRHLHESSSSKRADMIQQLMSDIKLQHKHWVYHLLGELSLMFLIPNYSREQYAPENLALYKQAVQQYKKDHPMFPDTIEEFLENGGFEDGDEDEDEDDYMTDDEYANWEYSEKEYEYTEDDERYDKMINTVNEQVKIWIEILTKWLHSLRDTDLKEIYEYYKDDNDFYL